MLVGYARVSTVEQSLALQQDALTAAGCARISTDVASGALDARTGLADALDYVLDGDTRVVWRLDRLGRTLRHLIAQVTALDAVGVGFRSLTEAIDTTTTGGKLVFHIFGALAEFERAVIRERTLAGLAAARARGRQGGRPRGSRRRSRWRARSWQTACDRSRTCAAPFTSRARRSTATSRRAPSQLARRSRAGSYTSEAPHVRRNRLHWSAL